MRENRVLATEGPHAVSPAEFAAGQRRKLLRRLGAADVAGYTPRRQVNIALFGETIIDHMVRLDILGPFLAEFQSSVTSVAQAIEGRPTAASSIPRNIQDATTLRAAAAFPSSFGLTLFGPPEEEGHIPGLAPDLPMLLDEAMGTVMDIVDLSESTGKSDELLAERLVGLGPRSLKHLGAMAKTLTEAAAGVKVEWNPGHGNARVSDFTPGGAARVRYLCEESSYGSPELITVLGWLGGASSFRGFVEIRTDSHEIISARTAEELTGELIHYFGKRVQAQVEVTTVRFAGGRERRIFTVTSLSAVVGDE
jgi:hypothetical protein